MADVYFQHKVTGNKFEVVRFDNEKGLVYLKGDAGIEFDVAYDKERFIKFGYELKRA